MRFKHKVESTINWALSVRMCAKVEKGVGRRKILADPGTHTKCAL